MPGEGRSVNTAWLLNAYPGFIVQSVGLQQGKGKVAVQFAVMSQVNLLHTTFTEELADLVAAVDKGSGFGRRWDKLAPRVGLEPTT